MRVKVNEDILRGLIKEILDDSENELPGITGELSGVYPEPPEPPIAADPVTNFQDLGPDVDDESYFPNTVEELEVAVAKLVSRVGPSMVRPLYKGIRKAVLEMGTPKPSPAEKMSIQDEPTPEEEEVEAEEVEVSDFETEEKPSLSESKRLKILTNLIAEQGFNVLPRAVPMSPAAMKKGAEDPNLAGVKFAGEEEEEEEEVVDVPQVRSRQAPEAPKPPGQRVYSVEPTRSGPSSYTGQAEDEEEVEEIDPSLAKMIDDAPSVSPREREQRRKEAEVQAARSAEQSKVSSALAEKAAEEKHKIAKLIFKDDKDLSAKLDKLEDSMMLDTLLSPEQVFEVEEEFLNTSTAAELSRGGGRSFDEMSEEQRGNFAEILLDMQKSISNSAFRNIRDAGFMKFLHGLAVGPDQFQDKVFIITQEVPADALPIQKFLLKALPWSAEFKKEVKKAGGFPEFDPEAAGDILKYLSQNEQGAKEGGSLLDDYTSLVHYYLAAKDNFPGAEKSMRKFHFNKENGKEALELAVKGLSDRGDKETYNVLIKVLNSDMNRKEVEKQLGKGFQIPGLKIPAGA